MLSLGTIIEVNVSELGLVTPAGKVVWGKYAQVGSRIGHNTDTTGGNSVSCMRCPCVWVTAKFSKQIKAAVGRHQDLEVLVGLLLGLQVPLVPQCVGWIHGLSLAVCS